MLNILPSSIKTKAQNRKLWSRGSFGNRLRTWRKLSEWAESGYDGLTVLRYMAEGGSGPCVYNLEAPEIYKCYDAWIKAGWKEDLIVFHEAAPDQHLLMNGEIWNGAEHMYDMRYSMLKAQMRIALAQGPKTSTGLMSLLLIKQHMWPSSWEDLNWIISEYSDHVIEFSIYSVAVGDTPNRNAIIWEVRKY